MILITLGDLIGLAVIGIAILMAAAVYVPQYLRQRRCKHDTGVNETNACEAICRQCGKNLGFIGDWRMKEKR